MIEEKAPCFEFDDVRVEPRAFKIWKAGREVSLEPKAFRLLLFLLENRGRLIEKGELLDAVWKDTFVTENALTREIAKLRKMLGDDPRNAKYIETVHTQGYRFIAEVATLNGEDRPEAGLKEGLIERSESDSPRATVAPASIEAPNVDKAVAGGPAPVSPRYPSLKVLALVALTLATLFAATIFWKTRTEPGAPEATKVLKTAQITTWLGLDIYPTLSPDGSSIAYSSDHGGNFEIYVKPLAPGSRELQITSDGEQNLQPAWSPNGQQIAYYSKNRGGIWVVPALGGVARRLTEFGSEPAWSPDGSLIAFQSDALTNFGLGALAMPPSTIWVVPSRGGQAKQITQVGTPSGGHGDPSWSPDGRRIMFVTHDANLAEVWSVSARGDELKPLAPDGQLTEQRYSGPYTEPVYSPDGASVYFAGVERGVNFGVWKIPISPESGEPLGEPVAVFTTGFTPIRHLTISADGKKIAYSAQSQTSNLWSVQISPVTNEATTAPLALVQDTSLRKSNPTFSPDGKKIALTVWRLGSPANVWLMDADGENLVQLTTDPGGSSSPDWLMDNDQIVYVSNRKGRGILVFLNLKSGIEQTLPFEFGEDISFARLSPDGKRIAYNSRRSGTINLWTSTLDSKEPKQLTFDKELAGFPSWSPDGQLLAFEVKRGGDTHIAIIPSDGGEPTQLTFDAGQSFPHSWSPDGERIAFAGFRKGFWNVWWVSRKDKTQKQVTNHSRLNAYVRYPAWSPSGNQIVYEYAETTGNIWLAELK